MSKKSNKKRNRKRNLRKQGTRRSNSLIKQTITIAEPIPLIQPIKPIIRIENPEAVFNAVIRCVKDRTYTPKALAQEIPMGISNTRNLVKEFQFYQLNKGLREEWDIDGTDMEYYEPTLAQFMPGSRNIIALHSMKFDRSPIVQRNQLCRWYAAPEELITKQTELEQKLGIRAKYQRQWKKELEEVIESQNNKLVLEFAKSCGIYQQTEVVGGVVQSIAWTYFGYKNPVVAYEIANETGSFPGLLALYKYNHQMYLRVPTEDKPKVKATLDALFAAIEGRVNVPLHLRHWIFNHITL